MRILDPESLSKHVDRLYRAAWGLCGSREDAEDLVQETFARVLSRQRLLHGDDELYYLMRVLTADPKPLGRPEQALEIQELYATIAELPEDFRMALVAIDVLGLSYREASRALRVREATITTRLFRARKQVAQRLGDGDEPGEGAGREQRTTAREGAAPLAANEAHGEIAQGRREQMRSRGVLPGRDSP